jgi:hypothetical protein
MVPIAATASYVRPAPGHGGRNAIRLASSSRRPRRQSPIPFGRKRLVDDREGLFDVMAARFWVHFDDLEGFMGDLPVPFDHQIDQQAQVSRAIEATEAVDEGASMVLRVRATDQSDQDVGQPRRPFLRQAQPEALGKARPRLASYGYAPSGASP